jgi:hypothetical protein
MSQLLNDLLSQAASGNQTVSDQEQPVSALTAITAMSKKEQVGPTSLAKKVEVQKKSGNPSKDSVAYSNAVSLLSGYGQKSKTEEEKILEAPIEENIAKYGEEKALEIFWARQRGVGNVIRDQHSSASVPQMLGDTAIDIARGAHNMIGSIVGLPVGLVSDNAGSALAQYMERVNKEVDGVQSSSLNIQRRLAQQKNQLDARDNEAEYKKDIAEGDNSFISKLAREGKNALGAIANGIIRLADIAYIPFDPANTDYANFKTAILEDKAQLQDADGNTMTAEQAKDFVKELP